MGAPHGHGVHTWGVPGGRGRPGRDPRATQSLRYRGASEGPSRKVLAPRFTHPQTPRAQLRVTWRVASGAGAGGPSLPAAPPPVTVTARGCPASLPRPSPLSGRPGSGSAGVSTSVTDASVPSPDSCVHSVFPGLKSLGRLRGSAQTPPARSPAPPVTNPAVSKVRTCLRVQVQERDFPGVRWGPGPVASRDTGEMAPGRNCQPGPSRYRWGN